MELLAVCTLPSETGLLKDSIQNTFAMEQISNDATEAELDDYIAAFVAFYNEIPTGVDRTASAFNYAIAGFLSPVLSTAANASSVKLYDISADLAGTPHGSPLRSGFFTLGATIGAATPLPSEVAMAVTLEGVGRATAAVETAEGTRPMQRRTGRVFLGPLNNNAISVVSGVARPANVFQDTAIQAIIDLEDAIQAVGAAGDLGIWSRSDADVYSIDTVSVDNAFDTQRRRGEAATARRRVDAGNS